jgi:hypothetical protein
MTRNPVALVLVAALFLASCSVINAGLEGVAADLPVSGPYPAACDALGLSEMRCRATVARAAEQAGVIGRPVASVQLTRVVQPSPDCGTAPDGRPILCVRSGGGMWTGVVVRIELADGRTVEAEVRCGIGNSDAQECNDTGMPPISAWSSTIHGDVPCGDDPSNCTVSLPAFPSPDPATVASARPMELLDLSIPIGELGHQEVEIGRAGLPNGILSEIDIDPGRDPTIAVFGTDGVALHVRPTDPTRPPFNDAYERGTIEGVEEVAVYLVFDVIDTTQNATLPIARIVVR